VSDATSTEVDVGVSVDLRENWFFYRKQILCCLLKQSTRWAPVRDPPEQQSQAQAYCRSTTLI